MVDVPDDVIGHMVFFSRSCTSEAVNLRRSYDAAVARSSCFESSPQFGQSLVPLLRRPRSNASTRRLLFELLEPRHMLAIVVTPYDPSTALSTLINALLASNSGLTVIESDYAGANGQAGTYTNFLLNDGTTSVSMPNGIILTSGLASYAGSKSGPSDFGDFDALGDVDLDGLVSASTEDANARNSPLHSCTEYSVDSI